VRISNRDRNGAESLLSWLRGNGHSPIGAAAAKENAGVHDEGRVGRRGRKDQLLGRSFEVANRKWNHWRGNARAYFLSRDGGDDRLVVHSGDILKGGANSEVVDEHPAFTAGLAESIGSDVDGVG